MSGGPVAHGGPASEGRAAFVVHTDVFDGPLDLLLHIVERDGIDLAHFRVSDIASAYLAALDRLVSLDLVVAGEHLVMAARLVYLKSLELLPRPASVPEEEADPAAALADQLAAHAVLRAQADALDALPRIGRDVAVRAPLEPDPRARRLAPFSPWALLDLFEGLVARADARTAVLEVHGDVVDLGATRRALRTRLQLAGGHAWLHDLLVGGRAQKVVGFLAVLESHRDGEFDLQQEVHLGPVEVSLRQVAT